MPGTSEQLWRPIVRTPTQLAEIARNYTEWGDQPPSGYPALMPGEGSGRLFMTPEEVEERTSEATLLGMPVRLLHVPPGHDAIASAERWAVVEDPYFLGSLLDPPDREFATGTDRFSEHDTRILRWLAQGCRFFTDELRPLIPGAEQLFSLRTAGVEGEPLGMPTAMGSYPSHGLARMGDGVVMYERPDGRIDVLLIGRPDDGVWATIGGVGNRRDLNPDGTYSPEKCALRRCRQEAGLATDGLKTFIAARDLPVSGRTTASAGLATTAVGVLVDRAQHENYGRIRPGDAVQQRVGWVDAAQLLEENGDASDGTIRPGTRLPVWTTHMRYIAPAVAMASMTSDS